MLNGRYELIDFDAPASTTGCFKFINKPILRHSAEAFMSIIFALSLLMIIKLIGLDAPLNKRSEGGVSLEVSDIYLGVVVLLFLHMINGELYAVKKTIQTSKDLQQSFLRNAIPWFIGSSLSLSLKAIAIHKKWPDKIFENKHGNVFLECSDIVCVFATIFIYYFISGMMSMLLNRNTKMPVNSNIPFLQMHYQTFSLPAHDNFNSQPCETFMNP